MFVYLIIVQLVCTVLVHYLTARNKDNFKLAGIVYKCPLKVILGSVVNC